MNQQTIINLALREIGVLAATETVNAADLAQGSAVLQQVLDSWQAERLSIFAIQRLLFVPATLKQTYTLGPGGDFNVTPRPARITRYGVIVLSNPAQPLELPIDSLTEAQWQSIPVKNILSALPQRVWDDQQFPLRNLNYWPVPSVTINFTVYQWAALSTWPDYVTDVQFPPGYARALTLALAIELAPNFGATSQVTPLLAENARTAKERIKRVNAPMIDLRCDPMLQAPETEIYNWLTDQNVSLGN